jgi:hypothetical protein
VGFAPYNINILFYLTTGKIIISIRCGKYYYNHKVYVPSAPSRVVVVDAAAAAQRALVSSLSLRSRRHRRHHLRFDSSPIDSSSNGGVTNLDTGAIPQVDEGGDK